MSDYNTIVEDKIRADVMKTVEMMRTLRIAVISAALLLAFMTWRGCDSDKDKESRNAAYYSGKSVALEKCLEGRQQ